MAGIARLGAVSLDCADPRALAKFYADLTGGSIMFESDEFVAVQAPGSTWITAQKVTDHRPSSWPDDAVPKQVHLEFAVTELESSVSAAVSIGAQEAATQPSPDRWRVLIDPAGHPFCLTTLIPSD